MNLYDLVLRKDRMVDVSTEGVRATVLKRPGGTLRAVAIPAGERLRLRDAHQATCLRAFPGRPGWKAHGDAAATLRVWLQDAGGERVALAKAGNTAPFEPAPEAAPPQAWRLLNWLAGLPGRSSPPRLHAGTVAAVGSADAAVEVDLVWPAPVPEAFDLCLQADGGDIAVSVGPLVDVRHRLVPLLRGSGVEVGPGARPSVLPGDDRSVRYVEKMSQQQWSATYAKQTLDPKVAALWALYTVDSAHRLDGFAQGSLDFVFSSHVMEHLVNPLQVLLNWWQRLAPGGAIAGIVPDARFTFDLRQPLTTMAEIRSQFERGGHEPDAAMYERWCRYTAPGGSAESLREREYAIHVNYFSPDAFRLLMDAFVAEVGLASVFLESFPNGKDFGFMVCKP